MLISFRSFGDYEEFLQRKFFPEFLYIQYSNALSRSSIVTIESCLSQHLEGRRPAYLDDMVMAEEDVASPKKRSRDEGEICAVEDFLKTNY